MKLFIQTKGKQAIKKGELTTMEKLKVGDVFSFCQGGINFEKTKGATKDSLTGLVYQYAKVAGSKEKDSQAIDSKFSVFFIKHSTNEKAKRIRKSKRKYVQLLLFDFTSE